MLFNMYNVIVQLNNALFYALCVDYPPIKFNPPFRLVKLDRSPGIIMGWVSFPLSF